MEDRSNRWKAVQSALNKSNCISQHIRRPGAGAASAKTLRVETGEIELAPVTRRSLTLTLTSKTKVSRCCGPGDLQRALGAVPSLYLPPSEATVGVGVKDDPRPGARACSAGLAPGDGPPDQGSARKSKAAAQAGVSRGSHLAQLGALGLPGCRHAKAGPGAWLQGTSLPDSAAPRLIFASWRQVLQLQSLGRRSAAALRLPLTSPLRSSSMTCPALQCFSATYLDAYSRAYTTLTRAQCWCGLLPPRQASWKHCNCTPPPRRRNSELPDTHRSVGPWGHACTCTSDRHFGPASARRSAIRCLLSDASSHSAWAQQGFPWCCGFCSIKPVRISRPAFSL